MSALGEAAAVLGDRAQCDVPIGPLTTYRVGGSAALFMTVESDDDLAALCTAVAASGVEVFVIGKGSNLLVADAGVDGLAVVLGEAFAEIAIDDVVVTAGSAAALPVVARRSAAAGLTGFEWAVGVPGSIGGAVRMNAGGHGSDIAATLKRVRVADLVTGDDGWMATSALALGYRRSAISRTQLVLTAELELATGDRERAEAEITEIVRWRRENQPGGQNAGSVFTNPPGRQRRPLDRCCGLQGPSGRHRGGVRQARQLLHRRRRRIGRRRVRAHANRPGTGSRDPERGARAGDAPRRFRGKLWTGRRGLTITEAGLDTAAIDPRLRARRIAVRRDEGRKRLHRLTGLGVFAVVALLVVGLTRSPLLDVDRVRITGAEHTTSDDVQRAAGIKRHAPMTDLDLDRARRGVLALPWVRTVSITRDWPATVHVVITERVAVAVVTAGTAGFALVDGDGRVLELSAAPPSGFMLLANVPLPGPPGSTLDASASDALAVARAMPASLRPKVSTVVAQADGVVLRLVAGGVVRLGPATDLEPKLHAADTVLSEVDTTNLCAVDVRVASAPSLTRGKSCL